MSSKPETSKALASSAKCLGYRGEFIRRRMLQKSFKGDERGLKHLPKLSDTMLTGMEVLWRQRILCDVELVAADRKRIFGHRLVLATCSDYFYEQFIETPYTAISAQLEIPDIRGDILEVLVEAMYTSRVKVESGNVDNLMSSAHYLGMFIIMDACESFLLDHLSKDNCLQLLSTAYKYELDRLSDASLQTAAQNFHTISKKMLYRNLSIEHVVPLLKRNDLKVENELEVFFRARAWIDENKESRLQYAADLMSSIRLPLMTPAEVLDNVEGCNYLMDITECQRLVKEALHYHLMPARQCLLQSQRTVPRMPSAMSLLMTGGAPRLETDKVRDHVIRYDPVTGQWNHVTNIPEPRHHHAATVLHGFLYVAGGDGALEGVSPSRSVFRFDPRNHAWIEVAPMVCSRQDFQLAVFNNTIFAVGGRVSADTCLASVERYDPAADTWTEVAELHAPRRCAAVATLDGKLYAVGGSGARKPVFMDNNTTIACSRLLSSRVERYSPAENKWELLKPLATPRFFAHLLSTSGHMILVGGATIDDSGNIACVDTIERSEFGCAVINEKIYVFGGYDWTEKKRLVDVVCFDADTGSWTDLGQMPDHLTGAAAASLVLYGPPWSWDPPKAEHIDDI
ncbi:KLH31-like protein [Mya arenaria]|uniref:KLH31-like protein n=1 Tax=Mya arenaria TaxID=6604 RepID=A0ABY7E0H6_MYAAR|nr:KLH31-like protein [Mya arenaria]